MTSSTRLIADRYRLETPLGSGAMGVVWKGIDERLGRPVAIKQLLLQPGLSSADAEEAQARSMREGRIAARLQHPHAISVFDVAVEDGRPWLVMEYLPSRSLATVLAEQGPLPPQEVARIGRQVADALAAAHEAGIVHRDVKPGNVLLGDNGTVKITDFGISRASWDVTITRTGVLAGTPAYFAPEVARGHEPSPASDVFSLGSTLYAAVQGQPPFGLSENTLALLREVAEGRVQPPQHAGPLTPVLMQMLQVDPDARPTMSQVKHALGGVAAEGVAPPTPPEVAPAPPATAALPAGPGTRPPWRAPAPAAGGSRRSPSTRADTPPPPREDTDHADRRSAWWRRPGLVAVMVLVALLAGLAVVTAATRSDPEPAASPPSTPAAVPPPPVTTPPPSTTTPPPSTTTPAPTPAPAGELTPEGIRQTVQTYYGLLPGDTQTAWTYLGEPERDKAGGYSGYVDFWSGIASVQILGAITVEGNIARLGLRFERTDGAISNEAYQLTMSLAPDGRILIESSRITGSVNPAAGSGGTGSGNGNDGRQGRGRGRGGDDG